MMTMMMIMIMITMIRCRRKGLYMHLRYLFAVKNGE